MMIKAIVKSNSYVDSMSLMALSTKVNQLPLVNKAMIGMGTDMNKQVIGDVGLMTPEVEKAGRGDLIIVFEVAQESDIDTVLAAIEALQNEKKSEGSGEKSYTSLFKALEKEPESNFVLLSIAGEYIFLEAKDALNAGKNVMVFSDNVSVEEEISLKKLAIEKSLLLMGPDCGTAIINGTGLCFANKVKRGDIGVVAASGTGSQEISVQIDRLGAGISQLIGVGGRDLSEQVGGLMMFQGIQMLEADPQTKVIALISKPPAESVAQKIIETTKTISKPVVICFIGSQTSGSEHNIHFINNTLAAAAKAVELSLGQSVNPNGTVVDLNEATKGLATSQKYIRGLFAGGTVCDEIFYALKPYTQISSNVAGPVESRNQFGEKLQGNAVIDFGDDNYTQGRPHPMIDSTFRSQAILDQAKDPSVALIALDFELGFGANEDPVGSILPIIEEAQHIASKEGRKLVVLAYILGTDLDFQDKQSQRERLEKAGVLVVDSVFSLGETARHFIQEIN